MERSNTKMPKPWKFGVLQGKPTLTSFCFRSHQRSASAAAHRPPGDQEARTDTLMQNRDHFVEWCFARPPCGMQCQAMESWLKNRIVEMARPYFVRSASEQRAASVCSYKETTHAVAQDRGSRGKVQVSSELPGQAPLPGREDESR